MGIGESLREIANTIEEAEVDIEQERADHENELHKADKLANDFEAQRDALKNKAGRIMDLYEELHGARARRDFELALRLKGIE